MDEAPTGIDPELLARLGRMGVSLGAGGVATPAARPAVDDAPAPGAHVLPIEEAVPGRSAANAHGVCYVTDVRRALSEAHAGEPLGAVAELDAGALADLARDASLAGVPVRDAAFLDTETTGLAGGTGTYAFLIGIGRFVGETFQVRQFFMRDPSEERAQLVEAAEWLDGAAGLVTFNGRTFDAPLLATRYTLHRLSAPHGDLPHLDLLPLARRLWRLRLESCRLTALEAHVLGFEREDDVPGWLVPWRYLRYQSDGDARPLQGIFRHNALDILSMVSLVGRAARAWHRPEEAALHAPDWLSLSRAYAVAGDAGRAIAACRAALERGLPALQADEAQLRLAELARRAGDWPTAVATWRSMIDPPAPVPATARLLPFEALAKYREHHAEPRDPRGALEVAERARKLIAAGELRPRRGRARALRELDHRLARLRRKLGAGG